MKNFVQEGRSLTITAPANIASGAIVVAGSLVGVAQGAAASGQPVTIDTMGVFEVAKTTGAAWTLGARIAANGAVAAGTADAIGIAVAPAISSASTGKVGIFGHLLRGIPAA